MRLVTFVQKGRTRLGALDTAGPEETVVDLRAGDKRMPADIVSFISAGLEVRQRAEQIVASTPVGRRLRRSEVKLLAPIPRPGKILCIGLNYADHAAESRQEVPKWPTVFAKYATAVVGALQPIVIPLITEQVDYEGELGVVVGSYARNVTEADALDYVAGYLPFNDVSARDFQLQVSQWTVGKSFDTFAPMGPALVTVDEVADPQNLDLKVSIGEEVVQRSNTCNMMFSVARLIAFLSDVMTLEPGDVIATGTPSGVGAAQEPPRWLKPGDVVRVEITGLGSLENPVVAAPPTVPSAKAGIPQFKSTS